MNLEECFLKLSQMEDNGSLLYQNFSKECSEKLRPVMISFSKEEEEHKKIMIELCENGKLKEESLGEDVEKIFKSKWNIYLIMIKN